MLSNGFFLKIKFSKFLQTHFSSPIPIRMEKKLPHRVQFVMGYQKMPFRSTNFTTLHGLMCPEFWMIFGQKSSVQEGGTVRSDVMEFLLGCCCPFLRVCYMYNTINIMRQNSRQKVIFLDKKMASLPACKPYFDVF